MISIGQAAAAVVDHLRAVLELRERIAALKGTPPPLDVMPARWRTLQQDSRRFFADDPGWALLALDLGWDAWQLLGANRVKPFARIDQQGLLWLVNRARVDELDEAAWHGERDLPETAIARFGELVAAAAAPIDDVRGSAAYRRRALAVLAQRTLRWSLDALEQPRAA